MGKELECYNTIYALAESNCEENSPELLRIIKDRNEIVIKALTELKAIKEAKPSEALEEVKQIKFYVGTIIGLEFVKGTDIFSEAKKQDYEIFKIKCGKIEQALLKADKLEKAIKCIENRSAYNIKLKKYIFVNKLIYWGDDLMLIGYSDESKFKVEDYGITWKEVENDKQEENML